MIRASFTRQGERLSGFTVRGHAGYAPAGTDIVCAAVTSAAELAANTITEVMRSPARVRVEEGALSLSLTQLRGDASQAVLEGLRQHLGLLARQYPGHLIVVQVREKRCQSKEESQ